MPTPHGLRFWPTFKRALAAFRAEFATTRRLREFRDQIPVAGPLAGPCVAIGRHVPTRPEAPRPPADRDAVAARVRAALGRTLVEVDGAIDASTLGLAPPAAGPGYRAGGGPPAREASGGRPDAPDVAAAPEPC